MLFLVDKGANVPPLGVVVQSVPKIMSTSPWHSSTVLWAESFAGTFTVLQQPLAAVGRSMRAMHIHRTTSSSQEGPEREFPYLQHRKR